MALTPRNIWSPDASDNYALTTDLGVLTDSVDDAIDAAVLGLEGTSNYGVGTTAERTAALAGLPDGAVWYDTTLSAEYRRVSGAWVAVPAAPEDAYNYRWANAAARTAQAGMAAGDKGYQTDTLVEYWYSGSAWLVNMPGLNLIVPASVAGTGVTVSAHGTITLTAATTATINGCFTSRFDNYLIQMDLVTSVADIFYIQLRASGTNATTAYDNARHSVTNTTVAPTQSLNGSNFQTTGGYAAISGRVTGEIKLFGPALSAATQGSVESFVTPNPMTTSASKYSAGILHRTVASYDGFSLTQNTGSVTGTVRVYGYNQ